MACSRCAPLFFIRCFRSARDIRTSSRARSQRPIVEFFMRLPTPCIMISSGQPFPARVCAQLLANVFSNRRCSRNKMTVLAWHSAKSHADSAPFGRARNIRRVCDTGRTAALPEQTKTTHRQHQSMRATRKKRCAASFQMCTKLSEMRLCRNMSQFTRHAIRDAVPSRHESAWLSRARVDAAQRGKALGLAGVLGPSRRGGSRATAGPMTSRSPMPPMPPCGPRDPHRGFTSAGRPADDSGPVRGARTGRARCARGSRARRRGRSAARTGRRPAEAPRRP